MFTGLRHTSCDVLKIKFQSKADVESNITIQKNNSTPQSWLAGERVWIMNGGGGEEVEFMQSAYQPNCRNLNQYFLSQQSNLRPRVYEGNSHSNYLLNRYVRGELLSPTLDLVQPIELGIR